MPTIAFVQFDSAGERFAFYALCTVAALALLLLGYLLGKVFTASAYSKVVQQKEQDLFTAQKGFKNLYENELTGLKTERADLQKQVEALNHRVEEYRKKAAGLGGLFSSSSKKNDAMYALLLENEALEEALYSQNEKLKTERADSLKEQMRATSYRRVLMSQLLNDERIKQYVAEVIEDKHLPAPSGGNDRHALPAAGESSAGH
ncbi:MAG TPA: hypothetical protein VK324_01205 [Tepidisphaeraceae bacterium]|nr:hypothetical protein [Tepidisphaeraceae bacterium]